MTRVGLLYPAPDPISADNWSGTPRGLADGFGSLGMVVVPVPWTQSRAVRSAVAALARASGRRGSVARRAPVSALARTLPLSRQFGRAQPLDALVAMQTDTYDLRRVVGDSRVPIATYDDGTFAQFARHEDSDLRREGFPAADVRQWATRQRWACQRATACFVSTTWAGSSVVSDYGVPAQQVHTVGMGHRPRVGAPAERDWSTPRFLFVGVDWGRKNGDAVLSAFAAVREWFPDATLDVVGMHPPLDQPGVTTHGFLARSDPAAQQQLDRLFARSTAFVLPSRFDPSPIAYLEAASAGLPVVATTEGGAGELLGDAAITVHPQDPAALVKAMAQLADPHTAATLGALASVRAAECTWQAVAGRMARVLGLSR